MPVPAPPPPSAPPPPPFARACATSAACLEVAALRVAAGLDELSMVITTDRTSNGPVLTYPSPSSPGGAPRQEHWVLDSFRRDPWGGLSMTATAERVAAEVGMTRESLDQIALLRYQQYQAALAHNRAFQRAYMVPVTVPSRRGEPVVIDGDVGVHPTSAEGLAKLAPADAGGVVTYGTQTHPADGTAGLVVTTAARARAEVIRLSRHDVRVYALVQWVVVAGLSYRYGN